MQEIKTRAEMLAIRRKRRLKRRIKRTCVLLLSILLCVLFIIFTIKLTSTVKDLFDNNSTSNTQNRKDSGYPLSMFDFESIEVPDFVEVQMLDNPFARSRKKLDRINGIVIHYVGNPNTTAQNNRNYFNDINTTVCSHFIIGLNGEIIQCLPLDERSAASNDRNRDTFSIEVCHPDESGKFNLETYNSLKKLTFWLCDTFELKTDKIIRHYDVTGKICPKYYVENPKEWDQFKKEVDALFK